MKKKIVLISLFIIPIVVYMFFASGVYNFAKLPTLTENIYLPEKMITIDGDSLSSKGKITILGFLGDDVEGVTSEVFNLNEKIAKRFGDFNDFQLLMLVSPSQIQQVHSLRSDFSKYSKPGKWNYVVLSSEEIQKVFESLKCPYQLSIKNNSPYMFIIDKNNCLRGRVKDEDVGKLYGYNARSVAELNNKMVDDVKVILAEYRLALKKYNQNPAEPIRKK